MKNSFVQKPAAKMVKPRPGATGTQESEAMQEATELAADQERLKRKDDQVGEMLAAKWFVTQWTDPILMDRRTAMQMTVSRFYPDAHVAIDIFPYIGPDQQNEINLKRSIFTSADASWCGAQIKVKYAALSYADPLADVLKQIEG